MQQTQNYKLNLIGTSDAFSPNPLNENAEKTEAALSAMGGAVAQCQEENCLVKLGTAAIVGEKAPMSFDLSGVDMGQFCALLLFYQLPNYAGLKGVRLNDAGGLYVLQGSTSINTPNYLNGMGMVLFAPVGDLVLGLVQYHGVFVGGGTGAHGSSGAQFELSWEEIETVAFSSDCPVGSTAALFGIKP